MLIEFAELEYVVPSRIEFHDVPDGRPVSTNVNPFPKIAFSVMAPFIVTVAAAEPPVYEPDPDPDQLLNCNPWEGVAETVTEDPASYQPEGGDTVPFPAETSVVR